MIQHHSICQLCIRTHMTPYIVHVGTTSAQDVLILSRRLWTLRKLQSGSHPIRLIYMAMTPSVSATYTGCEVSL